MNNSINNSSINFQASMKLQGIEKSNKLKNVITSVRNRTQKYPHDTIVMSEQSFEVNDGKAVIPKKYMEELLAMPEELITNTIVKLFNMHKHAQISKRTMPNLIIENEFLKRNKKPTQGFMEALLEGNELFNHIAFKNEAEKHPILKHIDFDNLHLG